MAFDIRCPECKAKLRLDEAPDLDTPIECPRCGSQFGAPDDSAPAAAPGGAKKKDGAPPKRKKAKKQRTNPLVLLIAIGVGLVAIMGVGFLLKWFVGRADKVTEMLTYVPGDCNWARGINTGQLANYPGYNDQVSRFNTSAVQTASNDLAKAAGQDQADFLNYLIIAKNRQAGGTGTMYVIRSKKSFKPDALGAALPGSTPVTSGGQTCYQVGPNAGGVLAGATVYMPTSRIIVVVPPGGMQGQMLNGATAGKSNKAESFAGKLDATGRMAIKGSIWLLVRSTGSLSNYLPESVAGVSGDFPKLAEKAKTAKTFGAWTTPGGVGVRVGAAMECASSKDADELAASFRQGPLSKGDESEPTNQLKSALQFSNDKKTFGEFMQYISYKSDGPCAFLISKVEGDNAKRLMDVFNSTAAGGEGGQGSFGPPGGPGGGPPGGPGGPPGPRQ